VRHRLRFGLRLKFFLYSNTLIVVTMALVTILAVVHERRSRLESIEHQARSICEAMTLPINAALRSEDLEPAAKAKRVDDYIDEIQALHGLMRYVAVTGVDRRVAHSSDRDLVGKPFVRGLGLPAAGGPPAVEILEGLDDSRILEVRVPLDARGESSEFLVVGFSLNLIEAQVRAIAMQAALVALVLMIGNSALTAVYVETLIRPILALNRTMKRAAGGEFSVRARSRTGAEVAELAHAFNRMMDEIEETRDREKVRQVQLAHTEKMAAVGTLAAGVAHEVNNPLGGILACVENMRADLDNREMRERYLEVIHDGLARIEHTVANLLDFSRQRTMELAPTSVNHSMQHVVELADFQLREGRVEVDYDLDPGEPFVMADQFQIDQLFLNLVLNALQAMPDGGRLTLRTREKDGKVLAEVCDTGVGISEDLRLRIFDPFFTTREVGEGTGLGLTVSDSIVSSHEGTLEVESTPGKGSVFRVSFPASSTRTSERGSGEGTQTTPADR